MSFGKRLRELRNNKGLSMSMLAEELNTSSSRISDWENEKNKPSIDVVLDIGEYFDVTLDWLLKDEQVAKINSIDIINDSGTANFINYGIPFESPPNMNAIEVYNRIDLLAQKKSTSIKEIAEKADVSSQTLYRWKNGKSEPSYHALQAISKILDTSYSYLAQGVEEVHSKYGLDIYAKIFYALEERNSTFVELEKTTGITRQSLIDMAIGHSMPDYKNMEIIANYLEVPRTWLINSDRESLPNAANPFKVDIYRSNILLDQFSKLSERDQEEIEEIIKLKLKLSKEYNQPENNDDQGKG